MKLRLGTAATYFGFAIGVHTWQREAFSSGFLAYRCVSEALAAKLQVVALAVSFVLIGNGAALAQQIKTPGASTGGGLPSDSEASEQQPLTRGTLSTESWTQEVAVQRRLDEMRRELLDERGKSIDRWLMVIGLVLTFFGIVIAIVGLWAFDRFRKIEAEARGSATAAEQHAVKASELLEEIRRHKRQSEQELEAIRQLTAEAAQDEPQQASLVAAAVREDPNASLIDKAIGLAISHQGDGRTSEAVDLWRSIATIADSGNDKALQARARYSGAFLLLQSNPEEAIAGFNKALELDPKNLTAYGNRGVAKANLGRSDEAIADYDRVLELDPNYAKAYMNRGVARARLGQHQEAIADLDKAIDLDPNAAASYCNRGAVKSKLGDQLEAIADLDKAIDLDPNCAEAYRNRGDAKTILRDHRGAIADYDKAIDLDPRDATAYSNRGAAKGALGQHREALVDCDAALELDPNDAAARRNRNVAAEATLGLGEEAKEGH